MVVEQSGGEVVGPLVDVVISEMAAKTAGRAAISLKVSEVRRHLGTTADGLGIGEEIVAQYLSALGCVLTQTAVGEYAVKLPSWRLDLEREIDLIEEVARVYGYNRFADTLPSFAGAVRELPHAQQESTIRETLRALGFTEAISSTFTSAEEAEVFAGGAVAMGNPLSAEAGMLRPSLAPGMATMLALNLHRDVSSVRLFELGTVFGGSTAEVKERVGLALGATGGATATALYKAEDALFYETKGAIEALLAKFVGAVSFDASGLPAWIAVGRGARVLLEGEPVGVFGELSATELQARKLRQPCVIAVMDGQRLFDAALRQPVSRELSRFQAVERDFSFVFPDAVTWETIDAALHGADAALTMEELRSVRPVEIFRDAKGKAVDRPSKQRTLAGNPGAAGSYSLLLRVVFQSNERTLTEEEITRWTEWVVAQLKRLGGTQRA
jgi:phenylalanyl-tRNA synthetase beta chain